MQQQQATIGVKATYVPTNEHRSIALPTPPSFAVLVSKLAGLFAIDLVSDLRVHYIDDEADRVMMSSSDELTCAMSLVPTGKQLRLFVSIASHAASSLPNPPQQEDEVKANEPEEEADCALPTAIVSTVIDASPSSSSVACAVSASEASSQETEAMDALKGQLQAAGVEIGPDGTSTIDEKRCQRVLTRFEGDVAKAAKAIERMHARKHLRQQKQVIMMSAEARQAQREACRSERLAARLARQDQKQRNKQRDTDTDEAIDQSQKKVMQVDSAAIDSLMAFMAEQQGAPIGRGKCTAAWCKADGDVEAAKAALLAWSAKRQQRQHRNKKGADLDMEELLDQLASLGFGAPSVTAAGANDDGNDNAGKGKKASERIQRRNERLIKRFGGELNLVVEFLEARQAKVASRKSEVRKAPVAQGKPRCIRHHIDQEKKYQPQDEQVATAL